MCDDAYTLVVRFFSDSPSFRDGFEAGSLYERMRIGGVDQIRQMVHANSIGQIQHIASRLGWSVAFAPVDETWADMTATAPGGEGDGQ